MVNSLSFLMGCVLSDYVPNSTSVNREKCSIANSGVIFVLSFSWVRDRIRPHNMDCSGEFATP
jgi:hypothetical protein